MNAEQDHNFPLQRGGGVREYEQTGQEQKG